MLQRRLAANGVVYYASPLLEACGVPHAFSTRLGGVSSPPFDSLNLGNPSGCGTIDQDANLQENYRRLLVAIGCEDRQRCSVHQVHGNRVLHVVPNAPFKSGQQADALVSEDSARILSVRIADCVPVLLASADGGVVAAIHAGWRGVIAGIVESAARVLRGLNRCPIVAAIGPCISFEAFEVGPEVLSEFERVFGGDAPVRRRDDGKGHVDLREAIRLQLLRVGIEQIDSTDRCTVRDTGEFFSHRRDHGISGRMSAVIAPRRNSSH